MRRNMIGVQKEHKKLMNRGYKRHDSSSCKKTPSLEFFMDDEVITVVDSVWYDNGDSEHLLSDARLVEYKNWNLIVDGQYVDQYLDPVEKFILELKKSANEWLMECMARREEEVKSLFNTLKQGKKTEHMDVFGEWNEVILLGGLLGLTINTHHNNIMMVLHDGDCRTWRHGQEGCIRTALYYGYKKTLRQIHKYLDEKGTSIMDVLAE